MAKHIAQHQHMGIVCTNLEDAVFEPKYTISRISRIDHTPARIMKHDALHCKALDTTVYLEVMLPAIKNTVILGLSLATALNCNSNMLPRNIYPAP